MVGIAGEMKFKYNYTEEKMDKLQQKKKIDEFLLKAENIKLKEYNSPLTQGIFIPDYVGGPLCDEWLNEIYIFSNRYLISHPLFNQIKELYDYKTSRYSTFEDMVSLLKALANDNEFWLTSYSQENLSNNTQNLNNDSSYSIFISHRTSDKEYADIFVNFLVSIGVPFNNIFCSSLPGNDVEEQISKEVNLAIKKSVCNIILLSKEYYESTYCLNECGIIWYLNSMSIPVIPIGLKDITFENMLGFLDKNYILRRLNNDDDLDRIYDTLQKIGVVTSSTRQEVSRAISTLKERYNNIISNLKTETNNGNVQKANNEIIYTTDDEKVLMYYINTQKKRKFKKIDFLNWITDNEIFDIDADNAIDLISKINNNSIVDDYLDLNINFFKNITSDVMDQNSQFYIAYKNHQQLAKNTLMGLFNDDELKDESILFVSYMKEKNLHSFGDRWLADKQIDDIKKWESDNSILPILSSNYANCLSLFVKYNIVYPTDYTSYGNPKEYTLYNSAIDWIFGNEFEFSDLLKSTKIKYTKESDDFELPF